MFNLLNLQDNSLKDECFIIVFSLIFIAHCVVPGLQDAMQRNWDILSSLLMTSFYLLILDY